MSASPKSVCVPCRRVYKGEGRKTLLTDAIHIRKQWPLRWAGTGAGMHNAPMNCPVCHEPTVFVDWRWRPPRRANLREWKRVARNLTKKSVPQ